MDDQGSASVSTLKEPNVILEGSMLKLSRSKVWQERYFVFYSNQVLSYYHKKGESQPRAAYRITKEAGCEISDLYVEQRQQGTEKESLYCINITFTDNDNNTTASPIFQKDSFRDDSSFASLMSLRGRHKKRLSGGRSTTPPPLSSEDNSLSQLQELGEDLKKDYNIHNEENSITSFDSPKEHRRNRRWFRKGGSLDRSFPNLELESVGSNRNKTKGLKRSPNSVPSFVDMDTAPVLPEYETILEGCGKKDPVEVKETTAERPESTECHNSVVSEPTRPMKVPLLKRLSSRGSDTENKTGREKSRYEKQNAAEQEKLLGQYLDNKKVKKKKSRERVVETTKVAVAASAAVGLGVLTAGVGLAAGLVFLGGATALGGTVGVAEATLKSVWQKGGKVTLATTSFEEAKLWLSSLEACLEVENLKESTWGQLFAADGRKTTSALIPHDVELRTVTRDSDDSPIKDRTAKKALELPKGQSNLFLNDRNFFVEASARWRPLEGGWISFLGPGAQSIRIFREEKRKKVSGLSVGGITCTPLKTQVVLDAQPLDAFMCLMSYARIPPTADVLEPNSEQSASWRLIEKIDDHMDIVHLICRQLYLFPSWTEPRDFVLFRYWRYEPDGSYIVCFESVEHPMCPPQPGFVRGEMHQVCTIAPSKKFTKRRKGVVPSAPECLLTSVVQVDPKGWVPTKPMPFLSNQTYADAFGVSALLQILDIRDAIVNDRFVDVAPGLDQPTPAMGKARNGLRAGDQEIDNQDLNYDLRFVNRERCDSVTLDTLSGVETNPPPLNYDKWAEPDANSFIVRGSTYKTDRVKTNAGASIGRLIAVDLVLVDEPILSGVSVHPGERIQRALQQEKILIELGKESDMPPFIFIVNIVLPGPPFYHAVYYYAVDDMRTIDGSDGTGSSLLCKEFLFGDSDDFRDRTFKLIPRVVDGNFMVQKAVGSTPAIMGTKLKQYYVRNSRFMEVILNCGSSPVARGVIRLCLGYAKTLMVDMGFLLEADSQEYLPERIFGCARMKYPEFGPGRLRKVENPS